MRKKIFFLIAGFLVVLSAGAYFLHQRSERLGIAAQASTIATACKDAHSNGQQCYTQHFIKIVRADSLEKATQTLLVLQLMDIRQPDCHTTAHAISAVAVEKNPEQWLDVFSRVDPFACGRGFYHGIIEAHSREDPDFALNAQTMPQICTHAARSTEKGDRRAAAERSCYHALGHVLLVQERKDIRRAADLCPAISETVQFQCFLGVFMEEVKRENLIAHEIAEPLTLDENAAERMESLCRTFSELAALQCWRSVSFIYAALNYPSNESLYTKCRKAAPTERTQEVCYFRAASLRAASLLKKGVPIDSAASLCGRFFSPEKQFGDCVQEVLFWLVDAFPNSSGTIMEEFCGPLPAKEKDICANAIAQQLRYSASLTQQKKICRNAQGNLTLVCDALPIKKSAFAALVALWKNGVEALSGRSAPL